MKKLALLLFVGAPGVLVLAVLLSALNETVAALTFFGGELVVALFVLRQFARVVRGTWIRWRQPGSKEPTIPGTHEVTPLPPEPQERAEAVMAELMANVGKIGRFESGEFTPHPGTTNDDLRKATAVIKQVTETFNGISARQSEINDEWQDVERQRVEIIEMLKADGELEKFKSDPYLAMFLGLDQ